jgi:hypothetical protein
MTANFWGRQMQKAGGIIALIGGIFAVFAAGFTLLAGGLAGAVHSEKAALTIGLGWGGVVFSFAVIILAAIAMGANSKIPGALLIFCALAGAVLGGTLVAVFMVLAFIGGILATIGAKKSPSVA